MSTIVWAAAQHHANSAAAVLLMILAGLAAAGVYVFACWFWPYANCLRCEGTGKRRSPSGRAFRRCRRCKGTGRRLRTGRRIFNFFSLMWEGDD